MMPDWLWQIGERFSPERYLTLTRVQGCLWTAADYAIVVYLIRIGNLVRRHLGLRTHRVSWVILAATVPFALALLIAPTGQTFFRLDLVVTVPHFALILYLCVVNARPGALFLAELKERARTTPSAEQ
jgi:hypothetical protein